MRTGLAELGSRVSRPFPLLLFTPALILATSCTPAGPSAAVTNQAATPARERILTASIETEPNFIAGLAPMAGLGATDYWQRMFNAFLDLYTGEDQARPYLAEALPALNTDSWVVFPDG